MKKFKWDYSPVDTMTEARQARLTDYEWALIEALTTINNISRNWSDKRKACDRIVEITATILSGPKEG